MKRIKLLGMKLLNIPSNPQQDVRLLSISLRAWRGFTGVALVVALVYLIASWLLWQVWLSSALTDGPVSPFEPALKYGLAFLNLPVVFFYVAFPDANIGNTTQTRTFDSAITLGVGSMPSLILIVWAIMFGCIVSFAFYRQTFAGASGVPAEFGR